MLTKMVGMATLTLTWWLVEASQHSQLNICKDFFKRTTMATSSNIEMSVVNVYVGFVLLLHLLHHQVGIWELAPHGSSYLLYNS